MKKVSNSLSWLLILGVMGAILFSACAGPITIDVGGGGESGSTGDGGTVSSQTFFLLLIVLLVAMFAMILVAVSQ
jgi:hypothetical protein